MNDEFTLNISPEEQSYPNDSAYETLQKIMKDGEKLSLSFSLDKYGFPRVGVETKHTAWFAYQLKPESFSGIMEYLKTGKITKFDSDPLNVNKWESTEDFQEKILKLFVEAGATIQYTPIFRAYNGMLSAFISYKYGMISFRFKNTQEMMDYLIEHNQTLV